MKVLVICQHYYPEPFRISDICEELVKRGHEVSVVSGIPNYPMGKIYSGYEHNANKDEIINGVKVHRCNIHPRKRGIIHRIWNYYSYAFKSARYVKKLDASFDAVFIYQLSPVMMANAGIKYAKKHNKKCVLYCLDLWPASLGVGGINDGIMYKYFHKVSKKVYSSVDKILVSSKLFSEYFENQFGISATEYMPQYAEETFAPNDCKKLPNETVDLMFAGNIGAAQSVDTIIQAAAMCKDINNLQWHIVGDGKELDNCQRLANELDAPVIFHGRHPIEEMPSYYRMADAMLVTMIKDPIITLTLPGKVQSYMAAGKPIIGAIDGEACRIINDSASGICVPSEDAEKLAMAVREYVKNKNDEFSKNALKYCSDNFSKSAFIKKLEETLIDARVND